MTELLGDPWILLLLRDAMLGVRRYEDFHRYQGIGRNTLSNRLNKLVDVGVFETHIYQDNPPRKEYLLTVKGRELFGVLATMAAWGERWLDGASELIEMHHNCCGHKFQAKSVCSSCGETLDLTDVRFGLGGRFPAELNDRSDIRVRFSRDDSTR